MYKIFKINLDKCKEHPTNFGWQYMIVGERYVSRKTSIPDLQWPDAKKYPGVIPDYAFEAIGVDGADSLQFVDLADDDLMEEHNVGNYMLVSATDSIEDALNWALKALDTPY